MPRKDLYCAILIILCFFTFCYKVDGQMFCPDTQVYSIILKRCLDCAPCPASDETLERCTQGYRLCCQTSNVRPNGNLKCRMVTGWTDKDNAIGELSIDNARTSGTNATQRPNDTSGTDDSYNSGEIVTGPTTSITSVPEETAHHHELTRESNRKEYPSYLLMYLKVLFVVFGALVALPFVPYVFLIIAYLCRDMFKKCVNRRRRQDKECDL